MIAVEILPCPVCRSVPRIIEVRRRFKKSRGSDTENVKTKYVAVCLCGCDDRNSSSEIYKSMADCIDDWNDTVVWFERTAAKSDIRREIDDGVRDRYGCGYCSWGLPVHPRSRTYRCMLESCPYRDEIRRIGRFDTYEATADKASRRAFARAAKLVQEEAETATAERIEIKPVDLSCLGCALLCNGRSLSLRYVGGENAAQPAHCDYIEVYGKRRPCPAGSGCTEYVKKAKKA